MKTGSKGSCSGRCAYIDLASLLDDHRVNAELTGNQKVLALYDTPNFFTISSEASDYVRSGILNKERIATAVVTDRLAMRLLVNFLNKFKSPLMMFATEGEALAWLMSFRN